MANVNPLLLVGAVIGVVTALLVFAYASVKDKKGSMGFERNMADGEIVRRLIQYAKPYGGKFIIVGFLVLFSISYDIASPLIVGYIEELVVGDFTLDHLFASVAVYAGVLVFSMLSTYFQAVILQKVGQRIISDLREDLFTHIESLAHEQLNEIPVGKLVTRVTNDTNAISMMFTNLLVNLTKNAFVILGILVAMLCLNYELTLMVLCFVPFIVIFTVIFRKFSRRAYRKVKDATTDINTYLSENLSGIKVTQIFGREDEKMTEFRQKSQTLARATQEQIFVFGVFRPLVYMLYISSILCLFYLGRAFRPVPSSRSTCTSPSSLRRSRTWRSNSTGCSRPLRRRRKFSPSWTLSPRCRMPRTPSSWRTSRARSNSRMSGSAISPASGCCRAFRSM